MEFGIWAYEIDTKIAEELASRGFKLIIATKWSKEVYDFLRNNGILLLRWIRDLEMLPPTEYQFLSKYSDGIVVDPETPSNSDSFQYFYNELLPHYIQRFKLRVYGSATWSWQFPLFKALGTKLLNQRYGIDLELFIVGDKIFFEYDFIMDYPYISILADRRVKWGVDGHVKVVKEPDKIYAIFQTFTMEDDNPSKYEGMTWKPSMEQLKSWTRYAYEKGLRGVTFFNYPTMKKYYWDKFKEVEEFLD